jgi:tetratricopeptide (TPR) repeat protein
MNIQPVNLLWQRRYRGLLPFVANSLADDGQALLIRPDELEARTYQILSLGPDGQARELGAVSVETVSKFEVAPGGQFMLGVTDDDIYLFREGRKSRFLADRRVSYSDVALARQGGLFGCAFSDMMFASHTAALAEMGGRLAWTKDLAAPVNRVAITYDGRTVAIGGADGSVLALDHLRATVWECLQPEPVTALALGEAAHPCAAGTEAGSVFSIDGSGAVVWQTAVELPVRALAMDSAGEWVVAAAGDATGGLLVCFDREGAPVWETELATQPTGLALSPNGRFVGVSLQEGSALLFEADFGAARAAGRPAESELAEVETLVTAGHLPAARARLLELLERDPACLPAGERLADVEDRVVEERLVAARALAEEGNRGEALALLGETAQRFPYHAGLFAERCRLREAAVAGFQEAADRSLAADDAESALAALRELLRFDPRHQAAREQLAATQRRMADQLAAEGDACASRRDLAGALERWQKASALAPSPELEGRIRRGEIERSLAAGTALYQHGRFAEAAFQFKRVLALDPQHEEARRYLGYSQSAAGESLISSRFRKLE